MQPFTYFHLGVVDHRALRAREDHQAEAVVGEGLRLSPGQTRLDDIRRHGGQCALHMPVDVRQSLVPTSIYDVSERERK